MLEIDANSDIYLQWELIDYVTSSSNDLVEKTFFGDNFENVIDGFDYLFGHLC